MSYPKDCPRHGADGCRKGDCPDYMAVWLLGACSSGDPLRRAVVLVVEALQERTRGLDNEHAESTSQPTTIGRNGMGIWVGDDWTVEQRPNGDVHFHEPDHRDPPGVHSYEFEREVAEAIGAAAARSAS